MKPAFVATLILGLFLTAHLSAQGNVELAGTWKAEATGTGRIEWSVEVVDPATWTRSWTFAMPLTLNPSEQIMEYACHEGNRAMANILSAARADERAVTEGRRTTIRDIPTAAEGERER